MAAARKRPTNGMRRASTRRVPAKRSTSKRSTAKRSTPKRNPGLVIFGNPGTVVSRDVKAIVYRHGQTGELMVHAFGPHGEQIQPVARGTSLTIRKMPTGRTGVCAIARPGGRWELADERGKPLWESFE